MLSHFIKEVPFLALVLNDMRLKISTYLSIAICWSIYILKNKLKDKLQSI